MKWKLNSVRLYYFKQEVLDEYLKHPDRFQIDDDVMSGPIRTKDAYYFSLPDDKRNSETISQIRYLKRNLKSGALAIGVYEHDLAELPYKEQLYWASKEIENPDFTPDDENFEKSIKEGFEGEFIAHNDPLQCIYETIKSINTTLKNNLFKNDSENPYLRYPVVNTEQAYRNAHEELFKLIGSDSLNKKMLKEILVGRLHITHSELLDKQSRREKGSWALFKTLISKIPKASFDPFQRCQDARTGKAHEIAQAKIPDKDFRKMFLDDCSNILEELKRLESFLDSVF